MEKTDIQIPDAVRAKTLSLWENSLTCQRRKR
jgi:hypothetical protein